MEMHFMLILPEKIEIYALFCARKLLLFIFFLIFLASCFP